MRILILGATGRIGRLVLARALRDGHQVVAVVRDPTGLTPSPGLAIVAGDVLDGYVLREALEGVEAVVAALGPRANELDAELALEAAMRALVEAMAAERVDRLVALSGAGISVPGDRKPALDRLASAVVRQMARHVVGAKQREYDVFSRTELAWTALRPPLVRDGPAIGYRLSEQLTPGARVTRADTVDAIVDQLSDPSHLRTAPFVLPPQR